MNTNGVSVIITTVNRPNELKKAIKSCLQQNYSDMEIIVVVDGGNPEILEILSHYPNIKSISNVPNVGGASSRNIGIQNATKYWVALLDDDDEWLDDKLNIQIKELEEYEEKEVVSFTSLFTYVKNSDHKYILPREEYKLGENIGDYLFKLKNGRWNGWIQTSTLMAPKHVFLKYPFDPTLPKHQDWDWIMRIYQKSIPVVHIKQPLTIYHKISSTSVAQNPNWKFSYNWINKYKNIISDTSYSDFLISVVRNGVSKDSNLTIKERIMEIKKFGKYIPYRNRLKIGYYRFLLQYIYNFYKKRK
ncbi:glycosyltransferase family 2 protein [Enterococcus saccharolyticus]|uniref:Glycosyltransferase 2-like domain-containing protein n=1 Tax=Enterococcus saccharolyticus subsp. saccharolyticus ATCC 43076 TaxID=1139996 RepID=S0NFX7_9ENTE|nr:glycosyltransferase [Enterococcus saccharolyticus]EOT30776.1 hypothetical protein OMQ_00480 [Enterococcus saccharolyticus subsp. saccharolyticus ATCC 43076]EOT80337.1 hypothetical protein I572_00862 [Enterococcus saccharolyticus subsp. saccharolyticus ATCC 43076]